MRKGRRIKWPSEAEYPIHKQWNFSQIVPGQVLFKEKEEIWYDTGMSIKNNWKSVYDVTSVTEYMPFNYTPVQWNRFWCVLYITHLYSPSVTLRNWSIFFLYCSTSPPSLLPLYIVVFLPPPQLLSLMVVCVSCLGYCSLFSSLTFLRIATALLSSMPSKLLTVFTKSHNLIIH